MGRLDDIVLRNKHPGRYRKKKIPYSILLSLLVLVVIGLVIFTDLGMPKQPERDHTRVEGIQLRKVPARDASAAD